MAWDFYGWDFPDVPDSEIQTCRGALVKRYGGGYN